jgi:cytochrome oxidase Cu insertion factor (SCO1/SenC/PrrC family)
MIFRRVENILLERLDEQTLVFDPEKNLPYVLNEVAAYVLMNTDGKTDQETVAGRVCEAFEVGFDQALEDTKNLYAELSRKRIVTRVN